MRLSGVIASVVTVAGLCVGAMPAHAETDAEIPGLYPENILNFPAEVFDTLSDLPIARSDVGFIWVEVTEDNLESIVRQMADAKIPDEFVGGSYDVIWHADCRFSIDAKIVIPRRAPTSQFSDDELLIAQFLIATVIQNEMLNAKARAEMIRIAAQESCAERSYVFNRSGRNERFTNGLTRASYMIVAEKFVQVLNRASN